MDSLIIAWKYIRFNKWKTIILVASITIVAFLPLALDLFLEESQKKLLARATGTPLVVGTKGSALDLVMNTLYFGKEPPETITMQAPQNIFDTGLARPIPMSIRFKARGFPVVGTTLDYFDFRGLTLGAGSPLTFLGDCVLGADVVQKLNLKIGDRLLTSPETLFDLAGVYPLNMKVVGILEKSFSSDDQAVFVDIKTAWIIEGLVHGHADVTKTNDASVVLKKTDENITANAKLFHYNEITESNVDSFHFHGDSLNYPITAVIAVPFDEKSGTILQGRYLEKGEALQIVQPEKVIDELLQTIFRIKRIMNNVILVVAAATFLTIVLVYGLSLKLREREVQTMFKLGGRKSAIARFLGAEIFLTASLSAILCSVLIFIVNVIAMDIVKVMLID